MITHIQKITLFILVLCCSLSVAAASEAEYQKLSKTWTLNADGSQEFRYVMALTLHTHAAMNGKYGETFIQYNPTYQDLKINRSYTKQKNGNIVETPANAFVEVLPKNAADAPAYNHLKEMVVVHTGLELGATIYLDYTITSQPGYQPEIDVFEPIQPSSPVRDYRLSIVTPLDKTVYFTFGNLFQKALVAENNGQRTTSWNLRNVPQVSTSPSVSVSNGDMLYLAATTYGDKKTALQTLYKQMDQPSEAIQALAADLVKDAKCTNEKIKSIYHFVSHHLASSPLSHSETGNHIRSAQEVLETAYGTELEKANLLSALLNAAGMKAEVFAGYPVKAATGMALTAINHFYVAVDSQKYVLSPSSLARPQTVVFSQTPVYRVKNGLLVEFPASSNYQIVSEQKVSMKAGKWSVETDETVGTDLLPYFTEEKQTKTESMSMNTQHGYATLVLKESSYGISTLGYGHLNSSRKVNLMLPRLVDETYTYQVNCPSNMQLCTPITNKEIHNPAGNLVISVKKSGQHITVTRSLKLYKQLYTPAEYAALRSLLTTWSNVNNRTLLFAVK